MYSINVINLLNQCNQSTQSMYSIYSINVINLLNQRTSPNQRARNPSLENYHFCLRVDWPTRISGTTLKSNGGRVNRGVAFRKQQFINTYLHTWTSVWLLRSKLRHLEWVGVMQAQLPHFASKHWESGHPTKLPRMASQCCLHADSMNAGRRVCQTSTMALWWNQVQALKKGWMMLWQSRTYVMLHHPLRPCPPPRIRPESLRASTSIYFWLIFNLC